MGISKEEAEELLNDERNLLVKQPTFVPAHKGSRGGSNGTSPENKGKEIPHSLRVLIGASAHYDTIANVSEAFGVSKSVVSSAKAGKVGINRFDEELKEDVDEAVGVSKKDVRDLALDRISQMFAGVINDSNLSTLKPREAVSAAKDLAVIVDKLTPRNQSTNVAVYVHAPRVKDEKEFGEPLIVEHKVTETKSLR